jgi:hypothetical protein
MSTRHMQEDMTMNMKVIGSSKMIGYWTTTIIVTLELFVGGVTDLIHGRRAGAGWVTSSGPSFSPCSRSLRGRCDRQAGPSE